MSSENEKIERAQSQNQTDDLLVELEPWQHRALFEVDEYGLVFIITGRGAGKTFVNAPRVLRWCDLSTELYYGIFAPTEAQLQTILAPIQKALVELEIESCYEKAPPDLWRRSWDADGVLYPPPRLRQEKVWIWENGMHIFTGSVLNNAHTRAKSLDMNAILFDEGTEPGVKDDVFTTLIGCLRCGRATLQDDGSFRCVVPGHLHQLVMGANVPLRDPTHYIRPKARRLMEQEAARKAANKPPYFTLIQATSKDNRATGDSYIERLEAAFDEDTFKEQTSGDLFNVQAQHLSYYSFTDANIWPGIGYDNRRDLHMWFDFNKTPATTGLGQYLAPHEIAALVAKHPDDARALYNFGVFGELHSDNDPMDTLQVANALLDDPAKDLAHQDRFCRDCRDAGNGCNARIKEHVPTPARGWLCMNCGYERQTQYGKVHCSGKAVGFEQQRKFLHVPSNWHGLMNHRGNIFVYGDASGDQDTASGVLGSSWQIIKRVFSADLSDERVSYRIKAANPPVALRVLAVNGGLRAGNGSHAIHFSPICVNHIASCRGVIPDPKKNGDPKKVYPSAKEKLSGNEYWKLGHDMDGFGYFVDVNHPFIIPKADALPSMSQYQVPEVLDTRWRAP